MPRLPFSESDPLPPPPPAPRRRPDPALTVSDFAALLKGVLADTLPAKLRVTGEVSNLSSRSTGGHLFFSLKDAGATIRCVMFASNARSVRFPLQDGLAVIATGRVDFYEAQGHVQLYVDRLEPVGQGALELALRQLMEELCGLGYFDPARKRPLPMLPRKVAVVTSRSAAALQDVIHTAARRWPGCRLLLVDVRVQGAAAAPEIAAALERLSRDGPGLDIDAIILTRGGGSIEDLWAFNERIVADALVRCSIPVVAAIGHETDTTVAELVADVRCATPTQAAMTLIPDARALHHQLDQLGSRLSLLVRRDLRQRRTHLDALARQPLFRSPRHLLAPHGDRLAALHRTLRQAARARVAHDRAALDALARQPVFRTPRRLLDAAAERLRQLDHALRRATLAAADQRRRQLDTLARQLDAISPARVLDRGYSYTLGPDGRVLRHATDAPPGTRLTTHLADGSLRSVVEGEADATPPSPLQRPPVRRPHRRTKGDASQQPGLF